MSARYRLFRRAVVALGRVLLGFEIHGAENTPERGPLIVASNHSRFFDPVFVCMAVPRRIQWMAKRELFLPGLRRFFSFLGAFPVDRQGGGRSALRTALAFIADGRALGIFPEGTRRREGSTLEAKSGAVLLAVRGGARILPIHVGRIPGPIARIRGAKFRAHVGPAISLEGDLRGRQQYREAADELLRTIYALPEQVPKEAG
jgi:1-acyl-sn-glycerol-3-phosphate acyltransferase